MKHFLIASMIALVVAGGYSVPQLRADDAHHPKASKAKKATKPKQTKKPAKKSDAAIQSDFRKTSAQSTERT